MEFRLFITDDREEFANQTRFPEADIVVNEKPEEALPTLPINPNTFIVVATRGHRYDNTALLAAAKTPAKYVGLMGSKRKTILIYEDLMRGELTLERIREIRSPIGLDIRARTPEEIAISIMSEILMFRLGGSGSPMKLDDSQLERIEKKVAETLEEMIQKMKLTDKITEVMVPMHEVTVVKELRKRWQKHLISLLGSQ